MQEAFDIDIVRIPGKYTGFVGCQKNNSCIESSMKGLVETHVWQPLNDKYDLKVGEELTESAQVFQKGLKGPRLKQALHSWKAPRGLSFAQTLHIHGGSYWSMWH